MSLRVLVMGLNYAPEPTGIAPYTSAMAGFLAEAGHDVDVVTGFPHYPYWKIAAGYRGLRIAEQDGAVRVTRVRHPVPARPTGLGRIAAEAAFALHAAVVRVPRPDVVLAVSPALLTVAAALGRRRPGRTAVGVVVQDLYGSALAETGALGGRGAAAAAALERGLLTRADGVVAIHDTFRDSMSALGVDPARITVIRNWTHTGPAVGEPAAIRAKLGWREDETIVLHAGNMGSKQGLGNVIDAARIADDRRLPLRFVLMGAGNQRSQLEQLGRGVERLQFVDPLPVGEFETALAAADVLLLNELPDVAEMCVPSKLTSYFAAGRPVLAATSARSAATIEMAAARAGLRVPPGEPQMLVDGALALIGDVEQARAVGARGQAYARDVLSADAARSAYTSWVEALADDRSREPADSDNALRRSQ